MTIPNLVKRSLMGRHLLYKVLLFTLLAVGFATLFPLATKHSALLSLVVERLDTVIVKVAIAQPVAVAESARTEPFERGAAVRSAATVPTIPTQPPLLTATPTATNTPTVTKIPTQPPLPTNTPTVTKIPTQPPLPTSTPTATKIPTQPPLPTDTPTVVELLRLGNLVWYDQNNSGLVDVGESGIPGVIVQLFREGDDPATATPLATTVTDAQGLYLFENLQPGRYFVYLPTPPAAYPLSSTPTDNADNGEDNDDNGSQITSGGPVRSPVVTLTGGGEPTTDGDGANGDLTIDFGFCQPQPDLVLVKDVSTKTSLILPGLVVTYSLTYSNVGTTTAVGVIMTETVSSHTTFAAQASTPGWSCANGAATDTKCTFTLGNLAPGQRGEIYFAVKLDTNVSTGVTISNVALIGTETGQLEAESRNNQDNANIIVQSPTNLLESTEPKRTLSLRLYLPLVAN